MLRFLFKTMAVMCLAISVMFIIIDATRSLGASELVVTSLSESWTSFAPSSFALFDQWTNEDMPTFIRDTILAN
ncbi:MAG: hypothetical protein U5K75_02585, partial [Ahrensia sp.]|nr:hypothetical protein [Ahrensia sp.]